MQNTQNTTKTQNETPLKKKNGLFAALSSKLKGRDEWEVRDRVARAVGFFTAAIITYLLGGVELFFGTYPLCIALARSERRMLAPIALGSVALIISGKLPVIYIFASVSVLLIRTLAALLPFVLDELGRQKKSAAQPDYHPVKRTCQLPSHEVRTFNTKKEHAQGKSEREADECDGSDKAAFTYTQVIFKEPLATRLLCAAIGGLLCGILLLIQNNFSFYSLYGTLFLMSAAPAAVFAFSGYFGDKSHQTEPRAFVAFMTIAPLCVVFALNKSIIGMPMAPFLCMLITLYISSKKGMLWGVGAALVCGLAFDFTYIPLLAFGAIIFCLISVFKQGAGLAAVCALVVIWCYYVGGSVGLVSVLPPMLLAIPVYMTADKYRRLMHAPYDRNAILSGGVFFAQAVTEKTKNEAVRERLGALSEAFASISETFYKLSDRLRRPDMLDPSRISEAAFSKHCDTCHRRELCWGAKYSETLDAIKSVTAALHSKGSADETDLPSEFRSRCGKSRDILYEVDNSVKNMTESIFKGEKIGVFLSSYDDMTAILKDALGADGDDYRFDSEAGEKIFDLLYSQGFKLGGVAVYGKRCLNVVIKGVSITDKISQKKQSELCRDISELVGVPLTEPSFELGSDGTLMRLRSKPQFSAKCAYGRICADEISSPSPKIIVDPFDDAAEELCGDTVNSFISDSSYFYALISDGMGSGAEAAFTSGVCSMFIEKMLCAGNRSDITLRVLNNFIRSENIERGGEVSATVDLFELDLIDGSALFMKSGAAPTYVVRGETVYKVSSRTMPIGIMREADVKINKFATQKGDIIIMMSDGCCPDSDDCPWLVNFLCDYTQKNAKLHASKKSYEAEECEALKDSLLSLAKSNFPRDRDGDDVSICVVAIE